MRESDDVIKVRTPRDSNIELLRIITMLGVIILHYNNRGIGEGLKYAIEGSVNYYILSFFESLFICAVDLFILISGYFMIKTQKRSFIKPMKLIIQVIVFKFGIYFLSIVVGNSTFSLRHLVSQFIPNNYFVILYTALYFISPYINIVMRSLDEKQLKRFVFTVFVIFSVYAVIADILGNLRGKSFIGLSSIGMYGSQNGYTIVNFTLMYIIGAYIKLNEERFKSIRQTKLLLIFGALVGIDMIEEIIKHMLHRTSGSAYSYLNPVVILCAATVFLIFRNLKTGHIPLINVMAKGSFTVFLLHNIFMKHIGIRRFVTGNPIIMVIHVIISSIMLYFICFVAYFIYDKISDPIYKRICSKIDRTEYVVESIK